MKQTYRTVLVIGENPDEIISKYAEETKVDKHLVLKKDEISSYKENQIKILEESLNAIDVTDQQRIMAEEYINIVKETSDEDYFFEITKGCEYDDTTGDAYSYYNPNAYYRFARSPQKEFEKNGQESGFCNPLKLYDNFISYSATKEEVDWSLNHLQNQEVYKSAWEVVVEGREPENPQEETIKNCMINRKAYFNNFSSKEEYVAYSTAFWTYGVATEDKYVEMGMDQTTDKQWISEFYERFIVPLPNDTLLTIYEVQALWN